MNEIAWNDSPPPPRSEARPQPFKDPEDTSRHFRSGGSAKKKEAHKSGYRFIVIDNG